MPNKKREGEKLDLLPDCFSASPRIYCSLFVTPSLFVSPPRGACGGGFFLGAAGGTCDSSERMSPARVTLWRPAEDTEMLHSFLRLHLIELVIIAREQNVTEAVFQNLRPPLAAVTGVLLPGTNQQWSLVPQ